MGDCRLCVAAREPVARLRPARRCLGAWTGFDVRVARERHCISRLWIGAELWLAHRGASGAGGGRGADVGFRSGVGYFGSASGSARPCSWDLPNEHGGRLCPRPFDRRRTGRFVRLARGLLVSMDTRVAAVLARDGKAAGASRTSEHARLRSCGSFNSRRRAGEFTIGDQSKQNGGLVIVECDHARIVFRIVFFRIHYYREARWCAGSQLKSLSAPTVCHRYYPRRFRQLRQIRRRLARALLRDRSPALSCNDRRDVDACGCDHDTACRAGRGEIIRPIRYSRLERSRFGFGSAWPVDDQPIGCASGIPFCRICTERCGFRIRRVRGAEHELCDGIHPSRSTRRCRQYRQYDAHAGYCVRRNALEHAFRRTRAVPSKSARHS